MYLLYVSKIYFLSLLKISYELLIGFLFVTVVIGIIRLHTKDSAYFTKKLDKLRRYMYGKL